MATMYTKNANGICEKICHETVGELDTATRRIVQDTAANKTYVEGNVDAGLAADFRITLDTLVPLKQTDVVL